MGFPTPRPLSPPASPGMVNSKEQGFCAWFALNPRAWQVAGSLWDNWAGSKWPEILGTDTSDDWHLSEERGKEATLLPQSWEGNKGEGPKRGRFLSAECQPDIGAESTGFWAAAGSRAAGESPSCLCCWAKGRAQNRSDFGGCNVDRGWGAAGMA